MFGVGKLGAGELVLILGIALVIFGPSKLPEVGKSMGDALRQFKGSVNKLDDEIKTAVNPENDKEA